MLAHFILLQNTSGISPGVLNIIFIVGLIAVFYFFMIRPQQQKQKQQQNFISELKKGDYAVTIGGLHGKVAGFEDGCVLLEVDSKGTKLKFEKSSISYEFSSAAQKKTQSGS